MHPPEAKSLMTLCLCENKEAVVSQGINSQRHLGSNKSNRGIVAYELQSGCQAIDAIDRLYCGFTSCPENFAGYSTAFSVRRVVSFLANKIAASN